MSYGELAKGLIILLPTYIFETKVKIACKVPALVLVRSDEEALAKLVESALQISYPLNEKEEKIVKKYEGQYKFVGKVFMNENNVSLFNALIKMGFEVVVIES